MEDEYILFERYIAKEFTDEHMMIRLTCETDFEIMFSSPRFVKVYETLSSGSPYIIVDFVDANGDGVNINKIDTNAIFNLYFGRSLEDSRHARMKISKVVFDNGTLGKSENYAYTVHFVHESWNNFIHKTHNRGWSNIKYSDIVNQIVGEAGFNTLMVSETQTQQQFVSQPNWSNLQLLQQMTRKAKPVSGSSGHFEFSIDLEGNFFFMPLSDIIDKAHETRTDRPASENKNGVPLFRLDAISLNKEERKRLKEENVAMPISFNSFSVEEDFMDLIVKGGGGITTMYYDFDKGQYVKKENTMSQSDIKQLSEWSLIHPDNELSSYRMYGGRDANIEAKGANRLSDITNNIQKITIQSEGTPNIRVGDLVEVLIPNPPDKYSTPFNEVYSGYYIVSFVENAFRLHKNTAYRTSLTLSRQGIDKKEVEGYVRSTKGKSVR